MTILLVTADLGLGGAQQVVINLSNGFTLAGHKVGVFDVYPDLRKPDVVSKLHPSVDLISTTYHLQRHSLIHKALNSFFYRTSLDKDFLKKKNSIEHRNQLKSWVKIHKPEVVNSHVWWADEWVYQNRSWLPDNWWITMHASHLEFDRNFRELEQETERRIKKVTEAANGYIYLSDKENAVLRNTYGISNLNFKKIYNGVPSKITNGQMKGVDSDSGANKPVLLCASRAIKEKGWEELIQASETLHKWGFEFELWLAGDGPMLSKWKATYGHLEYIKFLGYRNDVDKLISRSYLVILPSYTESLPTIILEAIVQKKPFVSTNVGEMSTIGHLIGAYNDDAILSLEPIESLGQRLATSIAGLFDEEAYRNYCNNLLSSNTDFTLESQVRSYLEVFKL